MDDLDNLSKKSDDLFGKVSKSTLLKRFLDDIKILWSMIKDYKSGEYREIPWWAISAIAFALLYVINPFDIIPDFVPFVGYVDDMLVVGLCIKMVEKEFDKYQEWKTSLA